MISDTTRTLQDGTKPFFIGKEREGNRRHRRLTAFSEPFSEVTGSIQIRQVLLPVSTRSPSETQESDSVYHARGREEVRSVAGQDQEVREEEQRPELDIAKQAIEQIYTKHPGISTLGRTRMPSQLLSHTLTHPPHQPSRACLRL